MSLIVLLYTEGIKSKPITVIVIIKTLLAVMN